MCLCVCVWVSVSVRVWRKSQRISRLYPTSSPYSKWRPTKLLCPRLSMRQVPVTRDSNDPLYRGAGPRSIFQLVSLTWGIISGENQDAFRSNFGGLDQWIPGWFHSNVDVDHDLASEDDSWEEPTIGMRFCVVRGLQISRWTVAWEPHICGINNDIKNLEFISNFVHYHRGCRKEVKYNVLLS